MHKFGYITQAAAEPAAIKAPLGLHLSSVPLQTGCTSPSVAAGGVLLRLRARRDAARQGLQEGLRRADHDRRPEDLHDAERQGPDGGRQGGLLRAAAQQLRQPEPRRGHRGDGPARHRLHPGHRGEPALRLRPGRGQHRLRGQHAVQRRRRRADGLVVEAVHAGHGAEAGHTVRLHAEGARTARSVGPFYSCKHEYISPTGRSTTPTATRTARSRSTSARPPRSTCSTSSSSRRSACATWCKTAISMGLTRANGRSLLNHGPASRAPGARARPPTTSPSFTLGAVNVSPLNMAGAYATVATGGIYCHPIAITKITDTAGKKLPVESAELPPRAVAGRRRRGQLRALRRADHRRRDRRRPRHRPPGRREDRYLRQGLLRGLRWLHADAGRLRLGVQPAAPDHDRVQRLAGRDATAARRRRSARIQVDT